MLEQLEEIAKHYETILLDTCVLFMPLTSSPRISIQEKIKHSNRITNSAIFFTEQFQNSGNFQVTHSVIEEYSPKTFSLKKRVKQKFVQGNRNELRWYRTIMRENKERRRLINVFEEKDMVFKLDKIKKEIYNYFRKIYSGFEEMRKLDETDLDFLISGLTIFDKNTSCLLISNDFQIMYAWRKIVLTQKLDSKNFGFYFRKQFNGFEKAYGD